jgi:hypothetical protein
MDPTVAFIPIPAITSFFKPVRSDDLDLPDDRDDEALMLNNTAFEPISTPTVVTRENIGKMIEYLIRQDDSKGFTSMIQRKAISFIMLCAMRCGIATLSDFSEDTIEREALRSVRIDPIIFRIWSALQ